jgi:hypothetical protein
MRRPRAMQRQLFEEARTVPTVNPPQEIQHQLRRMLVQWIQALAKAIDEEHGDEQDQC